MKCFQKIVVLVVIISLLVWRLIFLPTSAFKAYSTTSGPIDYIAQNPGKEGIAISKARGELYLMDCYPLLALFIGRGVMKTYRFQDVREWSINDVKAGRVFAVGFAALSAMGENARANAAAAADSGLFVTVRDIERPEWHIQMNRTQQKKWFEILRQSINED